MRVLIVTNEWPTAQSPNIGCQVQQLVSGLNQVGIETEVLFLDRLRHGMGVYASAARKVRSSINQGRVDLVHVIYGGIMAERVMSAVRDRPTVLSLCGSDLFGENLSGATRKLVSKCGVLASHRAARLATGIIVKSSNLKSALPASIDRRKVRIVPNGVRLDLFKPLDRDTCCDRLGWDSRLFHIVFPANMGDPVKRPELARQAVAALEAQGVQTQLHFLQGVPHKNVPVWLNACDVVMLTSAHEGSPNIVKEALSCNCAVVSVDVGDVKERISKIDGCYIALANPVELAAKLRQVLLNGRRVDGRSSVRDLSLHRISKEFHSFYRDVARLYADVPIRAQRVRVPE